METRRFMILYQRQRDRTLEREMTGTVEAVLRAAWDMLQAGDAKVAAIIEPGNLEFHIWHNRIVGWGREQAAREARTAARAAVRAPVATMPQTQPGLLRHPAADRPAA